MQPPTIDLLNVGMIIPLSLIVVFLFNVETVIPIYYDLLKSLL